MDDDPILTAMRMTADAQERELETSATPLGDALRAIPKNQVLVEGGAGRDTGAEVHGSLEHEDGRLSVGVEAGISQKKGWSTSGFVKWVFGRK